MPIDHPTPSRPRRSIPATERPPAIDPLTGAVPLQATVVEAPDGTRRCTVSPPGLDGVARMSTWLTADHAAFVDLRHWR